ncbi:MAG TPA: hypothetical protein VJ161_05300, partial [Geobacteraceae bacterium]|nr:hypothetical protein [Geobacteraceae bacterium]
NLPIKDHRSSVYTVAEVSTLSEYFDGMNSSESAIPLLRRSPRWAPLTVMAMIAIFSSISSSG